MKKVSNSTHGIFWPTPTEDTQKNLLAKISDLLNSSGRVFAALHFIRIHIEIIWARSRARYINTHKKCSSIYFKIMRKTLHLVAPMSYCTTFNNNEQEYFRLHE